MSSITARYNVSFSKPAGEKKRWIKVGTAVQWDGETIEIELDAMPVGNDWNGKLKLFKADPEKAKPATNYRASPRGQFA